MTTPITASPNNKKAVVTIVGGGNSAHVLIPFLTKTGHTVNLMTRRPEVWNKTVSVEMHDDKTGEDILDVLQGSLNKISSDPAVVIPSADVIILCMPVASYRNALHRLAPYIHPEKQNVFVGTVYGQAGFNWMVQEMERDFSLTNTVAFAIGLIPWICRTIEYGKLGACYGGKMNNLVAVSPEDRFDCLNKIFLEDISYNVMKQGKFLQCSFLAITLSVDNQFIHPSRCYGLWKRYGGHWPNEEAVPFFYKDFDKTSADVLRGIDEDYTLVRNALRKQFPEKPFEYMLDYLALERFSHQSANEDIQQSFQQSKQLSKIKTPTEMNENGEHVLNVHMRFFTDDIPYGLLIAKWIAQELHVETPHVDEVISWAQYMRGERFIKDGKVLVDRCLAEPFLSGIPPSYGITRVADILD